MWNNNNQSNYNDRPNNANFFNQNQGDHHINPLSPPPPPAYIQNMPQYQNNYGGNFQNNNQPRISNKAFLSQQNGSDGQQGHGTHGWRPFGNPEPPKNGYNKGFDTTPNKNNIGNYNFYSPDKKPRSKSKTNGERLSIQKDPRSRSRSRKNNNGKEGKLGDSFIPGYQKHDLSNRKLIWDENPLNFYTDKSPNYIPHPDNNYPFNPGNHFNPLLNNNYNQKIDTNNLKNNIGDSILVNPNEISPPGQVNQTENLPKIQQQDSQLFRSNMLNFEFQPKKERTEGGHNNRDRSKSSKNRKNRVNPQPTNTRYGKNGHQKKEWNNWVIQSFIPKPAVNSPNKQNQMNRSISFIASSKVFNLLKAELERKGKQFVDPKFPPEFSSIWGFGESRMPNQEKLKSLKWLNSQQIFRGRNYSVFQGGIDPSDIIQGMLGDCYFLSATSAIAERENRIKKLFLQRDNSKTGAYCVALCLNGMWEEVIVDDYFPCRRNSGKPAFNSSKKNEIWVMLLEKAWAKVHGGYLNIDGGLTREALHDLTGAPAITHYTDEQTLDEHWENIIEGDRKNYIMTAGSHDICGNGNDSRDPRTGLCGNHAYSLLAAYELKKSGNGYRVLQKGEDRRSASDRVVLLRNPWGKGEWNGEWSDRDRRWTSELRAELRHTLKEDGKFFMPFESFMKYFHDYQVCFYHDDFTYSSQRYNSEDSEPTFINFKIEKAGKYYFSINQINKRFFRKRDNYVYTPITLIVGRKSTTSKGYRYVGMVKKSDKEMWFKAVCQPGEYVALVETPWRHNVNQFTIASYGPGYVDFKLSPTRAPVDLIEKILIQKARLDKNSMKYYHDQNEPKIGYMFEHCNDGFGFFYFENASDSTVLTVTINLLKMQGCQLLPPYSGDSPKVIVNPQSSKIIAYKMVDERASINFRILASFKKGGKILSSTTKSKGKRHERKYQGNDVGIGVYVLHHQDGSVYTYENKSRDYVLYEKLEFNLKNCVIEGINGDSLDFVVEPGDETIINVRSSGKGKWSAKLRKGFYDVKKM